MKRILLLVCLWIGLTGCSSPLGSTGIHWPTTQVFPNFAPAGTLDVLDLASKTDDWKTLLVTLQGLVNRQQPRIWVLDGDVNFWLDQLAVATTSISDPLSLILKYRSEIQGIVVYDEGQTDTVNLATAMAGIQNGIVASPALATILSGAPYSLPVLADLRNNHFAGKLAVYRYELEKFGASASNRQLIGLDPTLAGNLRDYAVATRALVVWLDPRNTEEAVLLEGFLARLPPMMMNSYLGWWVIDPLPKTTTAEEAGVILTSRYGVPVYAADHSTNLTVFGGGPPLEGAPPLAPSPPPLEKKAYVAMFMSDGDNLQLDQHAVRKKWADPARGKVPIGWTLSPALVEVAPLILAYFRRTATANDVLVSGPSGLGYTYPRFWPAGQFPRYTQTSQRYLAEAGFRIITVWNGAEFPISDALAQTYDRDIPKLLGLTIQNQDEASKLRMIDGRLPLIGLRPDYAQTGDDFVKGIDSALAGWNHTAPLFIAMQGESNQIPITPTTFLNVQQRYAGRSDVAFVRPDHFFELATLANRTGVHRLLQGDFNGDGKSDVAFLYSGDDNLWVGLSNGTTLDWHVAGNTRGFGNLLDSDHELYTGDFNGDGKTDLAFFFNGDGNWWLGLSDGNTFNWRLASHTAGFGNVLDANHRVFTGDFNGDGKCDVLFYYNGDGRWWLGLSDGATLTWRQATNSARFGNLLDAGHKIFIGDFNGDRKADVLFHYSGDGRWWLGISDGASLAWRSIGNTSGFGNLLDASHAIFTGDFNGDGKSDVLFYYNGDGRWWLGLSDGSTLNWRLAANTHGFGDLLDTAHRFVQGDFNGDGKADVAFYYRGDSRWWMGLSDGSQIAWRGAGIVAGFGDLLDANHRLFTGDYNGDRKTDALFYYSGDGRWWMGVSDGNTFSWHEAAKTHGFGNLLN